MLSHITAGVSKIFWAGSTKSTGGNKRKNCPPCEDRKTLKTPAPDSQTRRNRKNKGDNAWSREVSKPTPAPRPPARRTSKNRRSKKKETKQRKKAKLNPRATFHKRTKLPYMRTYSFRFHIDSNYRHRHNYQQTQKKKKKWKIQGSEK